MNPYPKIDEVNIHDRYCVKSYLAPDSMTFKRLLAILRPDFRPGFVKVTENVEKDMKSFGEAAYDYEYYISCYADTEDGLESLGGTTVSGHDVSICVVRNDEMNRTEIRTSSKDSSVELDQIILMEPYSLPS